MLLFLFLKMVPPHPPWRVQPGLKSTMETRLDLLGDKAFKNVRAARNLRTCLVSPFHFMGKGTC